MEHKLPDINLLPEREKQTSLFQVLFIIFTSLLVLFYSWFIFQYITTNHALVDEKEVATKLDKEIDQINLEIDQYSTVHEAMVMDIVAFLENQQWITSPLIEEIDQLLPSQGSLNQYTYANKEATFLAEFSTLDDLAAYTTKLNELDYASDVKVNQVDASQLEEREEGASYRGRFTLKLNKGVLKEVGKHDE